MSTFVSPGIRVGLESLTGRAPVERSLRKWATFLGDIRRFFDERGFVEVTTASLVPAGAFEGTIDALEVSWSSGKGELHTSPEIEMKRILSEAAIPIYQIGPCFRDDPATASHRIEFTMLEYYRPACGYQVTRADMIELFSALAGKKLEVRSESVREAVHRLTGLDLDTLRDPSEFARVLAQRKLAFVSADDTWEDLFFKLVLDHVEPALDPAVPVLLYDYPVEVSPLSKRSANAAYAERFEIYWRGMEICNGCTELADLPELRLRHAKEARLRQVRGVSPRPEPTRLFEAFEKGYPSSSGVAVGLDRLFACLDHKS